MSDLEPQTLSQEELDIILNEHMNAYKEGKEIVIYNKLLRGISLKGRKLNGVRFRNCGLQEIDLSDSVINGCGFEGSYLQNSNFNGSSIFRSNLMANFNQATFAGAEISTCQAYCAEMMSVDFTDAVLNYTDLSYATLSESNLTNVTLSGVRGNGRQIKSLFLSIWMITYTATDMAIGCTQHPIEKWWELSKEEFNFIDDKAWEIWLEYSNLLKDILTKLPAVPYIEADGKLVKPAFQGE